MLVESFIVSEILLLNFFIFCIFSFNNICKTFLISCTRFYSGLTKTANFGVGGYSLNLSFFCLFFIFYFLVNFLLIIMKNFLLNIQSPFFSIDDVMCN